MEKRISLNKIPKEEKDRIIKTRPRVIALIEEVEETNMNQEKAPKWFTEFANKQEKFNNEQRKFNETLMSLPTIKKELEELNK